MHLSPEKELFQKENCLSNIFQPSFFTGYVIFVDGDVW